MELLLIGDTRRLAIVPLSFSPAIISVPIPIAPAKRRIVIKYGSIVPIALPLAFFSSWMYISSLSEFIWNTVSCSMSLTLWDSRNCR